MASTPQRQQGQNNSVSILNGLIQVLNIAKEISTVTPAKAAFGSIGALLEMIRDYLANQQDYVDLGQTCADACKPLERGLEGRRLDELSRSVLQAIEQLTITVAAIREKVIQQGKRNTASRLLLAKDDKAKIAAWRLDLMRILQVFNTELAINTHVMVTDIHRNVVTGQGNPGQDHSAPTSTFLGESPPPAPRVCFGCEELVEKVIRFAENLEPIALVGAGGIGKTSIALTVLHDNRIRERFGDRRRFIRCDQFPSSRAHFLARLSKVIGAGVENPEDLAPLRPLLSSTEMLIVLDNAESILDPQGPNSQEIYTVVDELCQFKTICLCITSRITTVPRYCKRPRIPTLSMEAACEIFYRIYGDDERSCIVDDLLQRLDFHALSITLLATTASKNMWDHDRLAEEWGKHRAQALRTDHNESLAATIELSLSSPTFRKLGPNARDLLGVVSFFPQGVDEKNLEWLFPTISDGKNIFDKFCVLSLAYRSNGFVTMLAPVRDYLCPQDPKSSPLLCATKDCYFAWLSVHFTPNEPGFGETWWIVLEDVNIEHLLDVFTSIDAGAPDVWDACVSFMSHLYLYKPRQTVLRSKIEALPDRHPSKPGCLFELSRLSGSVGNYPEQKRLLTRTLALQRESGEDSRMAQTLRSLSHVNRMLGLYGEGIQQAEEALETYREFGDTMGQANCFHHLAWLLLHSGQVGAAEDAVLRTIGFLPEQGQDYLLCQSHHALGAIYRSKGEKEKAIHHFETAIGIATPFSWRGQLFRIHLCLALLFCYEGELDSANSHAERAKSYTVGNAYHLCQAMQMQAMIWYLQRRPGDAGFLALCAVEIYEKLGAARDAGGCRELLRRIEQELESRSISSKSNSNAYGTPSITPTEIPQGGGIEGPGRISPP